MPIVRDLGEHFLDHKKNAIGLKRRPHTHASRVFNFAGLTVFS